MASDLLALLDTLDGLHKAATEGEWFVAQGLGGSQLDSVCGGERGRNVVAFGTRSREDAASITALHNAYPRLAQALRTALTPTTDGEREAREALAAFDTPLCGREYADLDMPGWCKLCTHLQGHAGPCSDGNERHLSIDHLRTALALLAAERAEHAMLRASLTVPERYVGVVTEAMAEEMEALRAKAADAIERGAHKETP